MTGLRVAAGLVHGMGKELVEPDWPPLTGDEVNAVLTRYGVPAGQGLAACGTRNAAAPRTGTIVAWRSPRPMSAAGLVCHGTGRPLTRRCPANACSAASWAAERTRT